MAACNGECKDVDVTKVDWFKIAQDGLEPNQANLQGRWIQGRLTSGDGWTIRIPYGLKPGNYLIRHEIIMLASLPAQFYPNCAQITIKSYGTKEPSDEYKVKFPGAYSPEGKHHPYKSSKCSSLPVQPLAFTEGQ